MTTAMPPLETQRLIIRPFTMDDLHAVHRALTLAWGGSEADLEERMPRRERWLRWQIANYEELASLDQPPYGDRAVVRKDSGTLVGSVGLVPSLGPFGQLPGYPTGQGSRRFFPEVGLFWAIHPAQQRQGFATEAARAVVDYAFSAFHLERIVATTEFDNEASMGVMRNLGMRLLHNPLPDPSWFQVVGLREAEGGL